MDSTPTHELVSQEKDCLEGKLPFAEVEQIVKAGAQQIDDHRIIIAFTNGAPTLPASVLYTLDSYST